jgi:hypothetical protein
MSVPSGLNCAVGNVGGHGAGGAPGLERGEPEDAAVDEGEGRACGLTETKETARTRSSGSPLVPSWKVWRVPDSAAELYRRRRGASSSRAEEDAPRAVGDALATKRTTPFLQRGDAELSERP